MFKTIKYYGAPGTGKTSTLVKLFKEAIESGYKPEEILVTQFRREAAVQGKQRFAFEAKVTQNRLKNVKTFHGLCYSLLKEAGFITESKEAMMTKQDIDQFNLEYGYNINNSNKKGDKEDPYLTFDSWMKNTLTPDIEASCYPNRGKISIESYLMFTRAYKEFKERNGKFDYCDLLLEVLLNRLTVNCKIQMYDEAQDMTKLMYEISNLWAESADKVYYAGDPLQTLYPFWGASPDYFLMLPAPMIQLKQSFRVPKDVWEVATDIIKSNSNRKIPQIIPKDDKGVHPAFTESTIKEFLKETFYPRLRSDSTVFHLTRTNRIGSEVATLLASLGVPYGGIDGWKRQEINFFNAISKLRQDMKLDNKDYAVLISLIPEWGITWTKSKEEMLWDMKEKDFMFQDWMIDSKIMTSFKTGNPCEYLNKPQSFVNKINGALQNDVKQITKEQIAQVQVLTIHGAKGLEAQNVFVHTKTSQTANKRLRDKTTREFESYSWYVAVTRTMKNLFVVKSKMYNFQLGGL